MSAGAAASDATGILGSGSDGCLVHTVHDDNLLCIVLASTRDTASPQSARDGAALVDDEVLDDRTLATSVGIAAKVAKEALPLGIRTVDNHVLDAMSLTVERSIVLSAVSWPNGAVQVDNILEVDVVHQLTVKVDVVVSDLLRNPFHIACIAEHVEAIRILLRALEMFITFVVHRTDTIDVFMVICKCSRTSKPHEAEDGKRGNLSHLLRNLR